MLKVGGWGGGSEVLISIEEKKNKNPGWCEDLPLILAPCT